jgi:rhomboid family GlyGly-CTERM serine protease
MALQFMPQQFITPSSIASLSLGIVIILLSIFSASLDPLLEFNRAGILSGEYWRILTCNFVHFGFAHTAMNLAAFLLVGFSLLLELNLKHYCLLFLCCVLAVGFGVLIGNPELDFYRGLSGVLHGLIVAGLLLNTFQKRWLSYFFTALIFAKIFHEHQAGFQENQLQAMLPVPVAVDSHLYGALAGLVYFCVFSVINLVKKTAL